MKKLLIILAVVTYFSSCVGIDDPPKYSESYIIEYIVGDISIIPRPKYDPIRHGAFANIVILSYGEGYKYKQISRNSDDPNDKALFEELCIKHGDTSYNRATYADCFASDFVSINIVSNVDYDKSHPAGSSLNDICMLESSSVYKYIQSGYKDMYDWTNNVVVEREYTGSSLRLEHPVIKMLDEIEPEDMILLGGKGTIADILFMEAPTTNKTHTITVTMVDDTGKTFVASTIVTF